MTLMDEAMADARQQYENMLQTVKIEGTDEVLGDHAGGKYLSTGYGQGYLHGYQTSAGAAHAGLSVTIGAIDAGVIDIGVAKAQLIELRDAIKDAAGL